MTDVLLQAELLAACSGLGYNDGARYYKEAECLETVKDLIRYLRRDDDSHEIRRALGETKVLQTDLIQIIKYYSDDKELFDVTLRLLVNLTNPVILLFKEELPEEKITRQQYLQMVSHQRAFKEAFADDHFWNVIVTQLGNILSQEEREEEDRLILERILILVRNILSVASSPDEEKRTDDDASVHDQVLWALHLARFEDLILYISSSQNEQDLCMHVIEIIYLMLKEQDAGQLANVALQRSQTEKEKDDKELSNIRKREALEKKQKFQKHYISRHSRFGGTFYVKNMKSISDRDVIAHKHINDISALNFDELKKSKKIPKNRLPLKDVDKTRRSTLAIRLFLQEFCIEFLNGAFNSLVYIVKDNLNRARAQEHDESYYLWAIQFFLAFNRDHDFKVELISEVLNIQTFHYIQMQLDNYYEMMTTDKKKIPLWSKRMHKALKAYQELLLTLSSMDKSSIKSVCESSKILKSKVFYVVEYRELVLILLQNYDELKMTKSYLKDLVETTHVFLKLLEGLCGKQRHLIVQAKAKTRRKKKPNKALSAPPSVEITEEELNNKWLEDEYPEKITYILENEIENLPTSIPYDPISEIPEEEQKELAMKKINSLLRKGQLKEAISFLISSRDIWPEGNIFGEPNRDIQTELNSIKMIFLANINSIPSFNEPTNEDEQSEQDSEEDEQNGYNESHISEQELNIPEYIRRFSHTKVIQAFSLMFKEFLNNSEYTNHCILKMFHRIAWDSKLPAVFFQASIFRIFQRVMNQPKETRTQSHNDAVKFVKFILRKFFEVAETNEKVFIEILFWKTNKEALEVECGYHSGPQETKSKSIWTEEEEDELRTLYDEFRNKPLEEGDSDIVDVISDNLINQTRTRRVIIRKLKELHLIEDVKELNKKSVKTRLPKEFSEEEKLQLSYLVPEYIDCENPIGRIMDHLTVKRPKHRIVEQILAMGLVKDKKQLRKKRQKKMNKRQNGDEFEKRRQNDESSDSEDVRQSENDDFSDEDNNDDDDELSNPRTRGISPPREIAPTMINSALNKVRNDHREALNWIVELLNETATERETDGDFEPVPLLALSQECNDAMDDQDFQDLLKLVGIKSPSSHEEVFWRIPSSLSIDALRKRSQFITQGIDKEFEPHELVTEINEVTNSPHKSSSDSDQLEESLDIRKKKKSTKLQIEQEERNISFNDRESSSNSDMEISLRKKKTKKPIQEYDGVHPENYILSSSDSDVEISLRKKKTKKPIQDYDGVHPENYILSSSDSDVEISLRKKKTKKPIQDYDGVHPENDIPNGTHETSSDNDEVEKCITLRKKVKRRTKLQIKQDDETSLEEDVPTNKRILSSDEEFQRGNILYNKKQKLDETDASLHLRLESEKNSQSDVTDNSDADIKNKESNSSDDEDMNIIRKKKKIQPIYESDDD